MPPALLSRVQNFLPQLQQANAAMMPTDTGGFELVERDASEDEASDDIAYKPEGQDGDSGSESEGEGESDVANGGGQPHIVMVRWTETPTHSPMMYLL